MTQHIAMEALVHEGQPLGMGLYAKYLIEGLTRQSHPYKVTLLDHMSRDFDKRKQDLWVPEHPQIHCDLRKFPRPLMQFLEERLGIKIQSRWLKKKKVDLFHGLRGILPPLSKDIKKVITVHDIGYFINPEWYIDNPYRRFEVSLQEADQIVTNSQFTKNCLVERFKINEKKITPIPFGVNPAFEVWHDTEKFHRIKSKLSLPDKFILFVGGLRPVKNLARILKAFHQFKQETGSDIKLVLTGKQVYGTDDVTTYIRDNKLENGIVFTGYVSQEELICLYNLAHIFVFTTLYEGFGFPVLESMACDTPVLASNSTCLPETCGDAALLVDPENVEAIAEGLHQLNSQEQLRKSLISKGRQRIQHFDWDQCVIGHLDIYQELLSS